MHTPGSRADKFSYPHLFDPINFGTLPPRSIMSLQENIYAFITYNLLNFAAYGCNFLSLTWHDAYPPGSGANKLPLFDSINFRTTPLSQTSCRAD